jgi:hypothetical protein
MTVKVFSVNAQILLRGKLKLTKALPTRYFIFTIPINVCPYLMQ